jgi:hypothetical protein
MADKPEQKEKGEPKPDKPGKPKEDEAVSPARPGAPPDYQRLEELRRKLARKYH